MRQKAPSKMGVVTFHSTYSTVKITEKTCNKCGVKRLIVEFDLRSSNADGRSGHCKYCKMEAQRVHVAKRKKEKDLWSQFSSI